MGTLSTIIILIAIANIAAKFMKILAYAMKIILKPIFYCLSQASYLHELEQKGSGCTGNFSYNTLNFKKIFTFLNNKRK